MLFIHPLMDFLKAFLLCRTQAVTVFVTMVAKIKTKVTATHFTL